MQDKTLSKITTAAIFTVFAAICGILEGMLPLQFIIPIPGVKLGIANIFVVFAYKRLGAAYASGVSICRTIVVFLFSGNSISFVLSLTGAVFSFAALMLMMRLHSKVFSYIGVSAVSAMLHGLGQLISAYFFVGNAVLYYLPVMLGACAVTGIFTGTLMNLSEKKIMSFFKEK